MPTLEIRVAEEPGASLARAKAAFGAIDAGLDPGEPRLHLGLPDWAWLLSRLTPERLDLLARLRQDPAAAEGREADLAVLEDMLLVERDEQGRPVPTVRQVTIRGPV